MTESLRNVYDARVLFCAVGTYAVALMCQTLSPMQIGRAARRKRLFSRKNGFYTDYTEASQRALLDGLRDVMLGVLL